MAFKRLLVAILFMVHVGNIFGQTLGSGPSQFSIGSASNKSADSTNYGNRSGEFVGGFYPGAIMIPINVWGATKTTGLFRVPKTTTLIELLSYAQGPSNDAKLNKVKIKRTAEKVEKTFTVDVSELIENPSAHDISLMANDVVYIEPKRPYIIDPQVTNTIAVVATIMGIVAAGYVIKQRGN